MTIHTQLHPYLSVLTPLALAAIASASTILLCCAIAVRSMRTVRAAERYKLLLRSLLLFALPLPLLFVGVVMQQENLRRFFVAPPPQARAVVTVEVAPGAILPRAQRADWQCPAAALLAAGSLLLIARLAWNTARSKQRIGNALLAAPADLTLLVDEVRRDAGLIEPIAAFVTDAVSSPAAFGVRHPFLVFPQQAILDLDERGLRAVIAHEIAHVMRRDNLARLSESLISSIFWFNPLVWVTRRDLALERERACDESAVPRLEERAHFLDALLTLCRGTAHDTTPGLSCINHSKISERIEYIMQLDTMTDSPASRRAAFLATTLLSLFFVVAIAFMTDKPLFAGESANEFSVQVRSRALDERRVFLQVEVYDRAGNLVASPNLITARGEAARALSGYSAQGFDRSFSVDITFNGPDSGSVVFKASENGRTLEEQTKAFVIGRAIPTEPEAQPISLSLKDANLQDVIHEFSKLTGQTFVVNPLVNGKVNIDVVGVPWTTALEQVAAQAGASVRRVGDTFHIDPSPDMKRRLPAPERAMRSAHGEVTYERQPAPARPAADGVTPPVVIRRVNPQYPAEARAARVAGIVIVALEIDEQGNVVSAVPLKKLPMGLTEAAVAAVKQWKFAPALKDGVPTRAKSNVVIEFNTDDE